VWRRLRPPWLQWWSQASTSASRCVQMRIRRPLRGACRNKVLGSWRRPRPEGHGLMDRAMPRSGAPMKPVSLFVCNSAGTDQTRDFTPAESVVVKNGTRLLAFHSPHSTLILVDWDLQAQELVGQRFLRLDLPVPAPSGRGSGCGRIQASSVPRPPSPRPSPRGRECLIRP